ncbi:hypothetical protein HYS10_02285 [Candidatus Collierbacteria bacterium]|nr:hypothetical protein [Candidatus Collierbacteria bacterium]
MAERTPRYFSDINQSRYEEFKRLLNNPEISRFLTNQVIEIIGPLNQRERWEWLDQVGLKQVRAHIDHLDGSAYVVAINIVDNAKSLGHPSSTALVLAVFENFGLENYENLLFPFLTEFTEEKEQS